MNKYPGSRRALVRYIFLQLPVIIMLILLLIFFQKTETVSGELLWVLLFIWIGKDIILYPFVWRAYDPHHHKKHSMIGLKGIASERLDPSGYIQVQGEFWLARIGDNSPVIEKGKIVQIHQIEGLTLVVKPESPNDSIAH